MSTCDKCGKYFKKKYLLNRHLKKKFPCDKTENINIENYRKINDIDKEINNKTEMSINTKRECLFCNKILINKGNLIRHINESCKIKKKLIKEKEKIIEDKNKLIEEQKNNSKYENLKYMKEEIKLLKEQNKLLKKNKNNITINNINNNTQNNLVMINPFGKEDQSHLNVEDYKKFLNGFFSGFFKYIEKVHFDENAPQNHNICISNLRSKYLTIHDGDKWVTKMKDDVLDRFINKKHNQLSDKCEYLEETKQIDKKIIENFEEFCENFNNKEAKKTTKTI